jgi:nuclear transport factor 2 (NTF2) superfamily protein
MARTVWDREIEFADKYNEPGRFTALIGFEWTSISTRENPGNLHRVVIFKDGRDKASQVVPFSTFDSYDPEKLWEYMADYEEKTGGSVLAIAHNGNVSNGQMFATERLNGRAITRDYAEMRARFEPLYEVTQIKGDGEAHPFLSPNDEFADYGTWDKSDIVGLNPKEDWMLKHEYARSALQIGMQLEEKLGVNPYKFGMIGSTDAHTSLATTREENFYGKAAHLEPEANRWEHTIIASLSGNPEFSSYSYESIGAGLAAVWARENTREGIFNAMIRKETYATTGTRIVVRFFGGWDYENDEVYRPDVISIGYRKGVPMGGDLAASPADKAAPTFMVGALKDPWSGNPEFSSYSYESIGAGLAAVWARENTREGIFNAMIRKETYATTGTRIVVRFFGGWDYDQDEVYRPDVISIGYRKGVPMGGDLAVRPAGKTGPTFMVGALKDPWSGNLDRIQIIKGWIDSDGERQERVYDVAVSDGRTIDADGRSRTPVGDTVDVADASYLNTIGDAELRAVWTDPDFNPEHRAFYYARVLEIPTPTWQAYDSKFYEVEMPDTIQMKGQERAYTSPIWYTP